MSGTAHTGARACICPPDYCLDDLADPDSCPVCQDLDPYDPCPKEPCPHDWLDRPESDTHECLMCGAEGSGPPPALRVARPGTCAS